MGCVLWYSCCSIVLIPIKTSPKKQRGQPRKPGCAVCGYAHVRSSGTWCARCWRLYQRARREGQDTKTFLKKLREKFKHERAALAS